MCLGASAPSGFNGVFVSLVKRCKKIGALKTHDSRDMPKRPKDAAACIIR